MTRPPFFGSSSHSFSMFCKMRSFGTPVNSLCFPLSIAFRSTNTVLQCCATAQSCSQGAKAEVSIQVLM